jgi:4-amino-4-deoxy-L-arabinose transferase-like glycosyltransferase
VIPAKWALSLLAVALIARIGAAIAIGGGFHFADEAIYLDAARRLSQGGGFGAGYQQTPGYPVFLMLLSLWLPRDLTVLRTFQAVVAAFGVLVVFQLADRMFGRRTAIPAGFAYALDPLLVIASGLLYPEAIAALLAPIVILAAWDGAERDAVPRSALAGGLLGLLALLRPVALILPPVLAGWIALTPAIRPARRLAHMGALAITFLLVLAPWTVRNYRIHSQLVPLASAGTHTAPVSRIEAANDGLVVSITRWAWHNPTSLVSRITRQFVQFWEPAPSRLTTDDPAKREELHRRDPRLGVKPPFPPGLRDLVSAGTFILELILALVGIGVVLRTRRRPALLVLSVILAWAIGYALFVAKLRYRIPVLPLLFLFTGAGVAAVFSLIRRAAARKNV